MRRRRQEGRLLIALALAAVSGCRCKGETKIGDKRAFACAEVPSKDVHDEIDLGDGKRLVRDGVRAVLRGVPEDQPALITSFEGGAADVPVPVGVAAVFVVGLGRLPREPLGKALGAIAAKAPLVVALAGPEDEVDLVRGAIADAGKRVVDGGVVRALSIANLEIVSVPGSDDPSSIAEHGRGCVVRPEDVRALAGKLGPASKDRPRIAVVYAAPSRDPARPLANDPLTDVGAWLVGGPLDRDGAVELALPPGAPPPLLPVPRAAAPRTTSTPGVIPAGYLLLRGDGGVVQLRREVAG
ncbi:MAG: hypothetical protein HYV09_17940 [Deltaproteobacteria bacterium]|nr:hypothetical protein [Deltaproteobacteria bacterium]